MLAKLDSLGKDEATYKAAYLDHVKKGTDSSAAAQALEEAVEQAANERQLIDTEADRLRAELAELDESAVTDATLDVFGKLSAIIRESGGGADVAKLNDQLRSVFHEFRIGLGEDGELTVWPVLRADTAEEAADSAVMSLLYSDEGAEASGSETGHKA